MINAFSKFTGIFITVESEVEDVSGHAYESISQKLTKERAQELALQLLSYTVSPQILLSIQRMIEESQ